MNHLMGRAIIQNIQFQRKVIGFSFSQVSRKFSQKRLSTEATKKNLLLHPREELLVVHCLFSYGRVFFTVFDSL